MALRHAVLAALLDHEYSGYQLAKIFDTGVANFWHALPQQLYAELVKLEEAGLISGRRVIQQDRPNKRVYTVTQLGLAELERFAGTESKPSCVRDDLLVKVYAVDSMDTNAVITQLLGRAEQAKAKIALFADLLRKLRGDVGEEEFLRHNEQIGPYLACQRGLRLEQENLEWCAHSANVLNARMAVRDGA